MSLPDGVGQTAHFGLPNERVERVVFLNIEVGHVAQQCRARALTITVDQTNPITLDDQILCEMARHGRLADTTLKVLHRDDRQWVVRCAPWLSAENRPHLVDLREAVGHATAR